jgi:hypothetical protein
MATTNKDALSTLMEAIDSLNLAYKAANTADNKDKIFSAMEILQDEVNAISVAGLAVSNAAYKAQTAVFKNASDQLTKFKTEIDKYVSYIKIAGQVADTLTKVIALL